MITQESAALQKKKKKKYFFQLTKNVKERKEKQINKKNLYSLPLI
jgi:hypothetical protein